MARSIWSGFLTFGLVSVPVGLYPATADQTIHFHQLHRGTSNRIRYKKVDEASGEEVDAADIVNGFDVGGGEYVVVTREELKEVAPGRSETIEISDFVDLDQIDPVFFRQTYYLAPRGKGADRAYALLRQALRGVVRRAGVDGGGFRVRRGAGGGAGHAGETRPGARSAHLAGQLIMGFTLARARRAENGHARPHEVHGGEPAQKIARDVQ